jgi:hypothetical protein
MHYSDVGAGSIAGRAEIPQRKPGVGLTWDSYPAPYEACSPSGCDDKRGS